MIVTTLLTATLPPPLVVPPLDGLADVLISTVVDEQADVAAVTLLPSPVAPCETATRRYVYTAPQPSPVRSANTTTGLVPEPIFWTAVVDIAVPWPLHSKYPVAAAPGAVTVPFIRNPVAVTPVAG